MERAVNWGMRCFVACFPSPESAEQLHSALRSSWTPPAGVRLTAVANYHLTLRFLGEIESGAVPEILGSVADLQSVPLTCEVVGLGGFPRARRAKVIFAELEARDELLRWAETLATTGFVPHVTVARARRGVGVPRLDGLRGLALDLMPPALYESVSVPGGVRYRQVRAASAGNQHA